MALPASNIKIEVEDPGGELDIARGRFESALLDLQNKDDVSESENGSDSDHKDRPMHDANDNSQIPRGNSILPTRPVRKRRRKETELRDGGFHNKFVMRMFERSVDLAQFEESSPLYPMCRAWMLNQPHNSDLNVKQEPESPYPDEVYEETDKDKSEDGEEQPVPKVTSLPSPLPWIDCDESLPHDPRIPKLLPSNAKKLNRVNEECHVTPALLLTQHLHRWRRIRNQWKDVGQRADARYYKSYAILKAMSEREGEKELWNNGDERKETDPEM